MKEIAIKAWHGGLGDSLQFSTLPERFSNLGYDVYLAHDATFRNREIKELVWDNNPYIKGQKNVKWALGDTPGMVYKNLHGEFIKNWEALHGIEPENIFPKIYYQPNTIDNIDGLIDISSVSTRYNESELVHIIKEYIDRNNPDNEFKIINNKFYPIENTHGFDIVNVDDLKHYVDMINSCNIFISVFSGQLPLAASIRHINTRFKHVCFIPEHNHGVPYVGSNETLYENISRRKFFMFPMVDYISI